MNDHEYNIPDWLEFANDGKDTATADGCLIHLIKERYTVEPLKGGYFVLGQSADDIAVKFAVLSNAGGYIKDGVTIEEGLCVFHGEGYAGNLREVRHTYWGENGYIYYVDGALITAAFARLSQLFGGMI
jgi:hypothetical protein